MLDLYVGHDSFKLTGKTREAEILEFVKDDVYVGPDSYEYGTYFMQEKHTHTHTHTHTQMQEKN